MQKIGVILHPPLDDVSGLKGGTENVEGGTVLDVLKALASRHPKLGEVLFDEGDISPFIHIFYNGEEVSSHQCSGQRVDDGGEVELLTAIRGG